MKKLSFILLIFTLVTSCSSKDLNKPIAAYKKQAEALVISIDEAGFKVIAENGESLVAKGKSLLSLLGKRWPKCSELFDKVVMDAEKMSKLSLDKIEKEYHDGESLPEADDECLNAKELVVHPATVLVLINEKDTKKTRERMKDEVEEVLSHLGILI